MHRQQFRRQAISRPVQTRVNERIRIREVRLIDDQGNQIGIIPTREALEMARERGLDLVEVAPNAVPPVCRLMDYGKFRYEQSRKERESRKSQHVTRVKEVRIEPKIGDHDLGPCDSKHLRRRRAEATRGAGNDHDLSAQRDFLGMREQRLQLGAKHFGHGGRLWRV